MNIRKARQIADLVNNSQFQGSHNQFRAAFQHLHMSADRGNKADRALARVLWESAGNWGTPGFPRRLLFTHGSDAP